MRFSPSHGGATGARQDGPAGGHAPTTTLEMSEEAGRLSEAAGHRQGPHTPVGRIASAANVSSY
jgi:hypothetical protein